MNQNLFLLSGDDRSGTNDKPDDGDGRIGHITAGDPGSRGIGSS